MSALKDLFQRIADAIRGKSGEPGTINPLDFPDKINALSIGSSENRTLTVKTGTFTTTDGGLSVVTHDMGIIPDMVFIQASHLPGTGNNNYNPIVDLGGIIFSLGFSSKVYGANTTGIGALEVVRPTGEIVAQTSSNDVDALDPPNYIKQFGFIYDVDSSIFKIGLNADTAFSLLKNVEYKWTAVSGLV